MKLPRVGPKIKRPGVSRIKRDTYGSKDEWRAVTTRVKERDNYTCQGKSCNCRDRLKLQVHHIVPLSRGGTTTPMNLITLCHECHEKRHKHLRNH